MRGRYGEIEINFIGLNELIKNKEASGRDQDLLCKEITKTSENVRARLDLSVLNECAILV